MRSGSVLRRRHVHETLSTWGAKYRFEIGAVDMRVSRKVLLAEMLVLIGNNLLAIGNSAYLHAWVYRFEAVQCEMMPEFLKKRLMLA